MITILFIALSNTIEHNYMEKKQVLNSQNKKALHLLLDSTIYLSSLGLQFDNEMEIQLLANALIKNDNVVAVSIFDNQGVKLAHAPIIAAAKTTDQKKWLVTQIEKYPVFVEPIYHNNDNIGYIEVRLRSTLFFMGESYSDYLTAKWQMLLISGFIGFFLARSISFKRFYYQKCKSRFLRIRAKRKQRLAKFKMCRIKKMDRCN